MSTRTIVIALIAIVSLFTLYNLSISSSFSMSSYSSEPLTLSDLKISLSESSKILKLTLKNSSPSTTYTIFTWDTPLDELALNVGALQITDSESGEVVYGPQLRLNRMMPPPDDAFVEVKPGESVEREVKLDKEWIPKRFKIKGQGTWRAVWKASREAVGNQRLKEVVGDLSGEVESEEIEVSLA